MCKGADGAEVLKTLEGIAVGKTAKGNSKDLLQQAAKNIKRMNKFCKTCNELFG